MSRIKLVNIKYKYIAIVLLFMIPFISSLIVPTPYIQLFASPICVLITIYLLQDELLEHIKTFKREYISKLLKILLMSILSQSTLNFICSLIFEQPHITENVNIPIYTIFIVSSAPILEEILFRHIIFRSLQRSKSRLSILVAATISSTLFAAMHMTTIGFLGYFAIGMIFCYYYHSTKNIYTTIIAHMIFNFLAVFGASIHIVFGGN